MRRPRVHVVQGRTLYSQDGADLYTVEHGDQRHRVWAAGSGPVAVFWLFAILHVPHSACSLLSNRWTSLCLCILQDIQEGLQVSCLGVYRGTHVNLVPCIIHGQYYSISMGFTVPC